MAKAIGSKFPGGQLISGGGSVVALQCDSHHNGDTCAFVHIPWESESTALRSTSSRLQITDCLRDPVYLLSFSSWELLDYYPQYVGVRVEGAERECGPPKN